MKEILEIPQIPYSVYLMHDVEYKRVKGRAGLDRRGLYLQILVPRSEDRTKPAEAMPIVLHVVGGGWASPMTHYYLPYAVGLAKRGCVVAVTEYRGREYFTNWREQVQDVRSAIRYMRKHAAEYSGNPNQIFLIGDSAGAHLSLLSGAEGNEFDCPDDDLSIPASVSGIMELFGPTDPAGICRDLYADPNPPQPITDIMKDTFTDFVKTTDQRELLKRLEETSVLKRVREGAKMPPVLIAQGDQDILVPVWCAEELYTALETAGVYTEYYLLKGARHGDMRFYEKDMLDRYTAFIDKCS